MITDNGAYRDTVLGLLLQEQEEKLEFLVRFLQPWSRTLCEDNNDAAATRVPPVVWRIVGQEEDEETRSLYYYHRHHLPPSPTPSSGC